MSWLPIIVVETILASAITIVLYWWDKRVAQSSPSNSSSSGRSRRGSDSRSGQTPRRISERTLLLASLLGGWPGGWWASRRFRHKTQKRSFRIRFVAVCMIHVVAVLCLLRFG
ncbi:DUF1294 domain-containing protein [Neorhodopirellula pilleata]|uniref:DUF1294 domain-containing protein n=1 Tax=Neorhodopirellula pilleata TaxID=2714738 RepID=A0A5C6ABR8_9BACT|nr:DUF1294 domain-containing protein [Neorhodopirellula pilleata]TWT97482.1 hypothetical protein Pla100_26360 [Neorhodopirellula pilleata]